MRKTFRLYNFLIFLGGVIALCWLLVIPGDAKNSWLLGFSRNRALLILFVFMCDLPIAILLTLGYRNQEMDEKMLCIAKEKLSNKAFLKAIIFFSLLEIIVGALILLIAIVTEDNYLQGVFSRLAPLMLWAVINGVLTLLFLYFSDLIPKNKQSIIRIQILETALLSILLLFFLTINTGSIQNKSYTADEFRHYRYGRNMLELNSSRFDDSKMPLSALNAIPKKISYLISNQYLYPRFADPLSGRIITIGFSMLIAYFIYRWAKLLYGAPAGFFALFLYIFDPNIIAHSRLITTDIYAVGMILLTLYTFWLFCNNPNLKKLLISAIVLGVCQLAKYTGAYLYPLLLTIALIRVFPAWIASFRNKKYLMILKDIKSGVNYALVFLTISVVIINIGFLFNRTFTPIKDYSFRSELFQSIQVKLSKIGFMPVPVPYPYLEGLDWVKQREQTGAGYGNTYLFGEVREGKGFNGYFIYASLLKVPISTQIFILLALSLYLLGQKEFNFTKNEIFLLLPVGFFFIYFNFFFRTQIGIRFYLIIFPFLYIFSGGLVLKWASMRKDRQIFTFGLMIYLGVSVLFAYPNYISYFNELVWDPRNAHKYLIDSNLDWNQAETQLYQYLKTNPTAQFQPEQPTFGTIVVSPNDLAGMWYVDEFQWLRDNFYPQATIDEVYLIYEISEAEFEKVFGQ
ncbi:MAG: glycosyltransferase family 39 protein [Anaerolineales bacterium]|uniref:Glycosyltransferase family 39 protein n=1 Tax=Candidatus Desulfolinea nitratireducens TaxID=2841698 RepID=A0A8J6TEY4_9CHLR|nr:glycosyltransferase family 39 protein [Candidatus Desulfolinea nitratireducens]MBL6959723.1 glycosyltransferase family 39 protein [Anaerolineales bacterium]